MEPPAHAPQPPEADPGGPPEIPDVTLNPRPLHRGPFAAIYRGWDRVHRCDVIAKVQRATGDSVAMERFRREAAVMARLRHPNVVALYRFYEGDPAALVLEYVPGQNLAALVARDGWLPVARAAGIIEGVAAALDCAHAQGIVHRDVKPSNILLPPRGPARLADFGVAYVEGDTPLTVMGDVLGTIEYASPEQVHGNESPDARSDVYSLAAVTYFALTGTPPFRAADNSTQAQLSVMHRQVFAEPPPLRFHRDDIAAGVEAVVLRGLAKAPDGRYQSAGQFASALRGAAEADAGAPELRAMAASSRRTGIQAGTAAGLTALLLAGFLIWKEARPEPPAASLNREAGGIHSPAPKPIAPVVTIPRPVPPAVPQAAVPKSAPPKPVLIAPKPEPKPLVVLAPLVAPKPVTPRPLPQPPPVPSAAKVAVAPRPVKPAVSPKPSKPVPVALVPPHVPVTPKPPLKAVPKVVPPHTAAVLATAHPPKPVPVPQKAATPAQGLLYVYARQNVAPLGHAPRLENVRAQAVYVDGKSVLALAAGKWAALPAGTHVVSFFPDAHSGFTPHTGVTVRLAAGAHVSRQILLPVMTSTSTAPRTAAVRPTPPRPVPAAVVPATGWLAVYGTRPADGQSGTTAGAHVPAQSVYVDGRPVPELANGGWAKLPAGRHVLTFVPASDSEAGSATYTVHVAPQSHLSQPIPLPYAAPPHLRNP